MLVDATLDFRGHRLRAHVPGHWPHDMPPAEPLHAFPFRNDVGPLPMEFDMPSVKICPIVEDARSMRRKAGGCERLR